MMSEQKLFIKNMVCGRCILAVQDILKKNKIAYKNVLLGEVQLQNELDKSQRDKIENDLKEVGFELIDNRKRTIIEKIKKSVLQFINNADEHDKKKLSAFISGQLNYDYSYLSDLFSSVEGVTIEQYFINQRIEKVKELLVYDQLSMSEIAYEVGFSSVHHMSAQFKKVTGLTPTHFKQVGSERRKTIDKV